MIAVMADPSVHQQAWLRGCSEVGAINFDRHFVVSAPAGELDVIEAGLRERGIVFQRLPVHYAFHSRWIDCMREPVASALASLRTSPGHIPLVCCERGGTISEWPVDHAWRVVRNPIRFRNTLLDLDRRGTHRYIDVGPAGTMATFAKYALPSTTASTTHAVLTPYGQDVRHLNALLASA
jgi:bacillaene synthase trans-acting acyltransferase